MRRRHRVGGSRCTTAIRVLQLRKHVKDLRYADLGELASMFGVSIRTMRRDLESLEEAQEHVPAWRLNEAA